MRTAFRPSVSRLVVLTLAGAALVTSGLFMQATRGQTANLSLDQQIAARESKIGPKDAVGHEELARFLFQHARYDEALDQVKAALAINPHFQDAILLKHIIDKKLQSMAAGQQSATTAPASHKVHKLLTMNDIYKIRLWELSPPEMRLNAPKPLEGRIVGGTKTLERFWTHVILRDPRYENDNLTQRDREHFMRPSNFPVQVHFMLQMGTAKYWNKIEILSDPAAMQIFRTTVQPFVLQSCATVGCHRGQDFKGFKLFGAGGTPNVRKTYTNFYILSTYAYKGQKLINRGNPQLSLIYQYALPRADAAYRHPGKKQIPYRTFNRQKILNWVESLRYPSHDYGFSYQLPKPASK